jgi:hypothetical protein
MDPDELDAREQWFPFLADDTAPRPREKPQTRRKRKTPTQNNE